MISRFLILFSLNWSPSKPNPNFNLILFPISFSLSALYPFISYKILEDTYPPSVSIPAESTKISSLAFLPFFLAFILNSKSTPSLAKNSLSTSNSLLLKSIFSTLPL